MEVEIDYTLWHRSAEGCCSALEEAESGVEWPRRMLLLIYYGTANMVIFDR